MPTAHERIAELVRGMRSRQEKEAQALAAWKKALSRCQAIAADIAAVATGFKIAVEIAGVALRLDVPGGARASFAFERQQMALVGRRTPASADKEADGEIFFTLRIEPPARASAQTAAWGPSPTEGVQALTPTAGSQEAFERAIADFLEWALIGPGCGGEHVRLP